MVWNIYVRENTLRMSTEVGDRLSDVAAENGHVIAYDWDDGIEFDQDAMEHMDFLWEDWATAALDDPSVNGLVIFGSVEGDNAGELWGYQYVEGKMTKIRVSQELVFQGEEA